jgi:acylphosphatase
MRAHLVVRGRVQGVGFRWFVREAARRLDLAGWVKNRQDGGVEVAVEGAAPAISALRQELGRGPRGADVTGVEDLADDVADDVDELPKPFIVLR